MNATDIRAEAEKRLAEIATQRTALDTEEAQLRAMLGAPAAPVAVPFIPPWWLAPAFPPLQPNPFTPFLPEYPWPLTFDPYRPSTTSDKIRITYGDPPGSTGVLFIARDTTACVNGIPQAFTWVGETQPSAEDYARALDAQRGQVIGGTQFYAGGSALQ
jgi:hypothetical protein